MNRRLAPWLLAAAAGLAIFAAHPPLGWWPTSFLAAPMLVSALWMAAPSRSLTVRRAGAIGVVAGVSAFAPMLVWIAAPAGLVAYVLLVGVQSAWYGVMAALIAPWRRHRLLPIIAAVMWTAVETWRSAWPLNGFGWGAIHYAHVDGSWLLPVARVAGGRGITWLVVLTSTAALVVIVAVTRVVSKRDWSSGEQLVHAQRASIAQLAIGLLIGALAVAEPPPVTGSIDVLVAQGHDVEFWDEPVADLAGHVARQLRDVTMAAIAADGPPDLIVWPENAIDRDPTSARGEPLAAIIDEVASGGGELITGVTLDGPDPVRNRYVAASRHVGGFGEVERYTKRRLVPFGEYVPLRRFLDWFPPLEQVPRDAIAGSSPHRMTTSGGVPVAVIICFETLFTDLVRTNVRAGDHAAQLILSITNDAAFRRTAEPDQHLAQSQMRAVETGRWVVHGALSGSSAFVDPEGRVHQATELFTVDTIRRQVPLVSGQTPYLRAGDVVGLSSRVLAIAIVAFGGWSWWRANRSGDLGSRRDEVASRSS